MTERSAPVPKPTEPFRGIESFRFMDRSIFFERQAETRTLSRLVIVFRGVLLYGGQGCGKSSLVNAGLISAVLKEGFMPERLRVQPISGREIVVERMESGEEGSGEFLPSWLATEAPRDVRLTLPAKDLHAIIRHRPEDGSTPLLIFDQFEELITLFEEQPSTKQAFDEAALAQAAVLDAVHQLLIAEELPVKLLFVFREDYLGKLSKLLNKHPRLRDQSLRLLPPESAALIPIISGPFAAHDFDRPFASDIVEQLAAAFAARSESGRVNLTEVQIASQTLWRNPQGPAEFLTAAAIDPVLAIASLLERYTQEAIAGLPEGLRDPAIVLLSRLLTTSGTRNIVEENGLIQEMVQEDGFQSEQARDALTELLQRVKLVRREIRNDTAFVEIASEFLVPWIKSQRAELEADRQAEERERNAKQEAERQSEVERQKYESKAQELKQQRLKNMIMVGGAALLITTAASVIAIQEAAKATKAKVATELALGAALSAQKETLSYIEKLKQSAAKAEEKAALAEVSLRENQKARLEADETITILQSGITKFDGLIQNSSLKTLARQETEQLTSVLAGFRDVQTRVEQSQASSQQAERATQAILQVEDTGPTAPDPIPGPSIAPRDAKSIVVISAHDGAINGAVFGNLRPLIATAGQDNDAIVWDLTGKEIAKFRASSRDGASCVGFSPNDTLLVAGSKGQSVSVFSVDRPAEAPIVLSRERQGRQAHLDIISSASFSQPVGDKVLTSSADKTLKYWSAVDASVLWSMSFGGMVNGALLSPDASFYACTVETPEPGHQLLFGSTSEGEVKGKVQLHGFARRPDLAASAQWLTCGTGDERGVPVCNVGTSAVDFLAHPVSVEAARFSPNGLYLATLARDRVLRVWRLSDRTLLHTLTDTEARDAPARLPLWEAQQQLIAWSPDSTCIIASAQQKEARVWNALNGALLQRLKGHEGTITSVLWQHNGSGAVMATTDVVGKVRLWLAPQTTVPSAR